MMYTRPGKLPLTEPSRSQFGLGVTALHSIALMAVCGNVTVHTDQCDGLFSALIGMVALIASRG